jgi:hypothetical protein
LSPETLALISTGLYGLYAAVKLISGAIKILEFATKAWAFATKVAAAAQWLFNIALDANPIGLIVIGIAALAAGLIYAYNHSKVFRQIVQGALHAVVTVATAVFDFFKKHWPLLLGILAGPFGIAVGYVIKNFGSIKSTVLGAFNAVVGFITGLPGRISKAASGMWDGIKDAFKAAINWIIDGWDSLQFKINVPKDIYGIPVPGGGGSFGFGVPHIDRLASGGPVYGPGSGTSDSILRRLSNGEHVWTAREVQAAGGHQALLDMRHNVLRGDVLAGITSGRGDTTINIPVHAVGDADVIGRAVVEAGRQTAWALAHS